MSIDERRASERLQELLNGDWDTMDPITRRALVIFGGEIDGLQRTIRALRTELQEWRTEQKAVEQKARGQFLSLYTAAITTAGVIIAAAIATFG